ncbi:MAG TPA: amino acid racemase [Deltaproteobacteria bacterium]|nr:amino acid racemase [Deltaproteobacteria bacterium]HPJ94451.1 amino acid racemase [Deltaproteobacteria bacterium]
MKTIGIIGGLGPESTLDYYKGIITRFQDDHPDQAYPEIVVYSADLNTFISLMEQQEWQKITDYLSERISALAQAGADFAAIASNTPHVVFDEVSVKSPIPLLSIVEETCKKAMNMGLTKIGLLGTKFTMESDFYKRPFVSSGMEIVVPEEADRALIHERLFSEIELGIIKDTTRAELLGIVKKMVEINSIDSVILGCTELPLILTKDEFGIPFLNTSAIHVESIVAYSLQE